MKKIIKRKLHISTYSRDFIDYINHEFYSHDKHNAFFEFTMEQLPTDNVVALFYFQKTKRYAEIHGVVEGNKVTIEFDTSLITTNETVCGYIYFEKVEQSADVCRFCFNVKVSEIDKLKNAPVVEKETRRLIPMSEIVTKTELQELFKTIERNGGTYNDTEIRKSISSIEERVQTLEAKPDQNTVYDDTDVINRLNELERLSNNQPTVDTSNFATNKKVEAVEERVQTLESKPIVDTSEFAKKTDIPQAYNDSELSRRVSALETKEDKDTIYNDEEIKRRLSHLEDKTDNFISGVSVNKEGNNVTLTYNYVDGQTKNVSFTDSDTVSIAYDDSGLKARLTKLEERPQIDVSEFAKKTDIPQAYNDSELSRRVSALETKEDKDTIYNDEEIKRRLSHLEDKTDNFISGVSVNKEGNNVTLTYNYVDGQTKNVSFTDSDTVSIAYDDSGLKARLTKLEERPQIDVSEFAKKSEVPTAESVANLTQKFGEQANKIQALETKAGYEIHGTGMPNGRVTAPIGTTYVDTAVTNGALKWIKESGNGDRGWKVLIGDTGWRTLNIVSKLNTASLQIRRVNNAVTYNFGGLSWGWFGIVRRNGQGYVGQGTDFERNCFILTEHSVPVGFRTPNSLIGPIYNDRGVAYGTWYIGNPSDNNHLRFQFLNPIPTDSDIGDIRVSTISYYTDDEWPTVLP